MVASSNEIKPQRCCGPLTTAQTINQSTMYKHVYLGSESQPDVDRIGRVLILIMISTVTVTVTVYEHLLCQDVCKVHP